MLTIPYTKLEKAFSRVRTEVLTFAAQGKIRVSEELTHGSITDMIAHGLSNLGLYHHQLPLIRNKAGDITTRDICSLFYYHNRLNGYGLEEHSA